MLVEYGIYICWESVGVSRRLSNRPTALDQLLSITRPSAVRFIFIPLDFFNSFTPIDFDDQPGGPSVLLWPHVGLVDINKKILSPSSTYNHRDHRVMSSIAFVLSSYLFFHPKIFLLFKKIDIFLFKISKSNLTSVVKLSLIETSVAVFWFSPKNVKPPPGLMLSISIRVITKAMIWRAERDYERALAILPASWNKHLPYAVKGARYPATPTLDFNSKSEHLSHSVWFIIISIFSSTLIYLYLYIYLAWFYFVVVRFGVVWSDWSCCEAAASLISFVVESYFVHIKTSSSGSENTNSIGSLYMVEQMTEHDPIGRILLLPKRKKLLVVLAKPKKEAHVNMRDGRTDVSRKEK